MKDGDYIVSLARRKQALDRYLPEVKAPIFNVSNGDMAHGGNLEHFDDCLDTAASWSGWNTMWYSKGTHNN